MMTGDLHATSLLHEPHRDRGGWVLRTEQRIPAPLDAVFAFFQDPYNLERLTPPYLHFHVRRASTNAVAQGTRLWYRLSLHGVPLWWRTRIDEWHPPRTFVDIQERGPYRRWHHTHEFLAEGDETLMRDVVHYDLWLARAIPDRVASWVHRDVRNIFEFRRQRIAELFGAAAAPIAPDAG